MTVNKTEKNSSIMVGSEEIFPCPYSELSETPLITFHYKFYSTAIFIPILEHYTTNIVKEFICCCTSLIHFPLLMFPFLMNS